MKTLTVFLSTIILGFNTANAQPKPPASETHEISLVTMEIPPFMSEHMPEQGAATYALKMIFKKRGYDLKMSFAPFLRSKNLATHDRDFVGYAPSTKYNIIKGFTLSKAFYQSPWVIIQNKENPVQWKKIEDLTKYLGGNVNGYDMVPEATRLYEAGKLKVEMAPDDVRNILKLAHKRVDYIFMDENMYKFLMATNPILKPFAEKLEIHPRRVETLSYGIAFRKTPQALEILDEMNKVFNEDEFTSYVNAYMKNLAAGVPK
jgi:polar amino acid transport system substrate-binding protein